MRFDISIVISSYNNRGNKIIQTFEHLCKSDLSDFTKIELIIIDDGSPTPVSAVLPKENNIPAKIEWRLITQPNSGIGATRNRGYREAQAGIVIFFDDDIIVEKDTLSKLFRAQKEGPGPVQFGNYPFISHSSESLHQFARQLYGYDTMTQATNFQQVNAISSGVLSVNKDQLKGITHFYKDDLTIPAAEEYELIARFHKMGIPIFRANHICTLHNHHLELKWLVQQQYKYGQGTAESFIKYPEIRMLEEFAGLKSNMDGVMKKKGFKSILKTIAASSPGRKFLLFYARLTEKMFPGRNHNNLFGITATAFFLAGYIYGWKKFGKAAP